MDIRRLESIRKTERFEPLTFRLVEGVRSNRCATTDRYTCPRFASKMLHFSLKILVQYLPPKAPLNRKTVDYYRNLGST